MYGNNPRKQIRKNIDHLIHQKALLDKKSRAFKQEIDRLWSLEKGDDMAQINFTSENWNEYSWLAFPDW